MGIGEKNFQLIIVTASLCILLLYNYQLYKINVYQNFLLLFPVAFSLRKIFKSEKYLHASLSLSEKFKDWQF